MDQQASMAANYVFIALSTTSNLIEVGNIIYALLII